MIRRILQHENCLDDQEKVSLVFLLCDDALKAYSILTKNVSSGDCDSILRDVCEYLVHSECEEMDNKFVESLILIKHYLLLRWLGYSKSEITELKEMYKNTERKYYINTVRKVLHIICESMSEEELAELVRLIEYDFKEQGSNFYNYGIRRMEMNLLFCLSEGYICDGLEKECDVSNLHSVLKKMKRYDLAKELVKTVRNIDTHSTVFYSDNNYTENAAFRIRSSFPLLTTYKEEDYYPMDKNSMGLCIIINQRNFSKELLKINDMQLDEIRHGTDNDRDMLKIVFVGFGYQVKILENLDSAEMCKCIRMIVREEVLSSHSSLVLCILSHGTRGAVYCVDGVEVLVEDIEHLILGEECPQLLMKPKMLFIQACQGNRFQRAMPSRSSIDEDDSSMIESDGPSDRCVPPMADLLTFCATVPGYASFRRPSTGSIFIQTLCFELMKRGHKDHLADILTNVNNQMSNQHFGEEKRVSVSQVKHTIRKKVYFPFCRESAIDSAKLLFEKYFTEFLIEECIVKTASFRYYMQM